MSFVEIPQAFDCEFTVEPNDLAKAVEYQRSTRTVALRVEALVVPRNTRILPNVRAILLQHMHCIPSEIVDSAKQLQAEIEQRGIKILRTRIIIYVQLDQRPEVLYYEYRNVDQPRDKRTISTETLTRYGVALSYVLHGDNSHTYLTFRHHGTREDGQMRYSSFLHEAQLLTTADALIIYDSCQMLDEGWL